MQISRLIMVAARVCSALAVSSFALPAAANAQAIASGPLVLLLPASTRATALGNAWVAVRDEYSVFYNPAQIAPTTGIGGSFARYRPGTFMGALSAGVTVGSLTYGWGVQLVEFKVPSGSTYPFQPAEITEPGINDALSLVAAIGANYTYKGFRYGAGFKYGEDRVAGIVGTSVPGPERYRFLLADAGVSHALLSGTAAVSVQNIGDGGHLRIPLQTALGWARQMPYKQIDLGFATQLLLRGEWLAPSAGIEVGYGWIEGYSAAFRAGARRTETDAQRPMTLGGRFIGDRLVLDYALEFFAQKRYAHHLSVRWQ